MSSSTILVEKTPPRSGGSLPLIILEERFHKEAAGPPPHTNQSPAVDTLDMKLPSSARVSSDSELGRNEYSSGLFFLKGSACNYYEKVKSF